MSRGAIAYIDLNALKHNYSRLQQLAAGRSILAMIKSNGYGHGLLRVAKTLNTADAFGVASLDEAIALRKGGIKQPIMVMAGFYDKDEIPQFVDYDLQVVLHRPDQITALEKNTLPTPLTVWMKIDTGMHRLGFPLNQVHSVFERLQRCESIKKPIGLMTHLADADNPDRQFTELQLAKFKEITNGLSGPKSIVNSAGLLSYNNEALADWVRPGIMLYGVSPISTHTGEEEGLKPVMTLTAKIMAVKQCRKGDKVGYGCTWTCPEDMPIGIVGIGYGDGYPRHAKNGTPTIVNGKTCPLIGRVSMDMIAIDLRSEANAAVGDRVTLWGEGLPVEKVAACANTIGYELLCNITQRVKFIPNDIDQ
ncbi:alanine racemase [Candidiatus Paracoxiella cheracis]|uniref:alanine racemase n=1 Tax=Candidiatus Paracoxiella cheracis TaxID=3405120 RepID=UPI003BF5B59C